MAPGGRGRVFRLAVAFELLTYRLPSGLSRWDIRGEFMISEILVPAGGSRTAHKAVEYAIGLAGK